MHSAEHRPGETPGPTARLAALASSLDPAALDAETRRAATRHLIDTVGAILAGAAQSVTATAASALLRAGASGPYGVPGRRERLDALAATYLAGASAHGLEVDDGYTAGSTHPGSVVVPAALFAAAMADAGGPVLLAALTAGYEAMTAVAAAQFPAQRWRGFHGTATSGVFGAAAAAGRARGLSAGAMANAFGLAASGAGGLFAFTHGGGDVKRLHPGHAAREGMLAALLAEDGMEGPPGVLEVRDGYFHAFAGDVAAAEKLSPMPGGRHAITRCYMKPYPCCRHIQPALEAMLILQRRHGLAPEQVEAIDVGTYKVAVAHDGVGWDNLATAQLSFPYIMAAGLLHRGLTLDAFSDAARADPRIPGLARRLSVRVDEDCDRRYPRQRPARVTLALTDGSRVSLAVDDCGGSEHDPLTDAQLEAKFLGLASVTLGEERARAALALLWRVEEMASVRNLLDALIPPCTSFDLCRVV